MNKPLSEKQMAFIAQGTLEALHYLHKDLNIIHRDIKAANLLLTDDGKVKISTYFQSDELIGCLALLTGVRMFSSGLWCQRAAEGQRAASQHYWNASLVSTRVAVCADAH